MPEIKKVDHVTIFHTTSGAGIGIAKETSQTDPPGMTEVEGAWPWPIQYDTLARLPELNSWHARCLEVIAASSVGIGFDLAEEDEAKEKAARAVIEDLAGEISFSELCSNIIFALAATGISPVEVTRNPKGAPAELFTMPPQYIWKKITDPVGYLYRPQTMTSIITFRPYGATREAGEHECLFLKTHFLRDRHYGMPRWLAAVRAISLDNSAVDFNTNFFTNSAIPDLIIWLEGGEFEPAVEQAIKTELTTKVKGTANAHRTILIPLPDPQMKGRIDFLNQGVKDAAFSKLREDNRNEIIGAHGVPPRILGVMSAGSLGGGGEVLGQIQVFDQVTLQPLREKLAKLLNKTVLRDLGLPEITFRKLDITAWKDDAAAMAALKTAGIISADEARGELGWEEGAPDETDGGQVADGGQATPPVNADVVKALERLEKAIAN